MTALAVVFAGAILARAVENAVWQSPQPAAEKNAAKPDAPKPAEKPAAQKTPVDFKADKADNDRELNRRLGLEDRAVIITGNAVFHHNGAVISCDSAIQHSARHIEWLGNVIINKDSTFIYADRADYNGETNLAQVFSPVIKIVDGSSTLYTYNFEFNTLENVGRWWGGGAIYQQGNEMESERGYYFSSLREMVAVGRVEMRNDGQQLIGDSVRYNTATRVATFYTPTTIWTRAGEIIDARRGSYNTADSAYFFHDHAYVLTPTREVWADTIDYSTMTGHALLTGNAQLVDAENSTAAWGDWVEYWDRPWVDSLTGTRRQKGEAMLTRRPTIANFDAEQAADTLYVRADTFFMAVAYRRDTLRSAARNGAEAGNGAEAAVDSLVADSRHADSLSAMSDSVAQSAVGAPTDSLAPQLSRQELRDRARAEKDSLRVQKDSLRQVRLDKKAAAKAEVRAKKLAGRAEKRAAKLAAKAEKLAAKLARRAEKRARRGLAPLFPRGVDSLTLRDTLPVSRQSGADVAPTEGANEGAYTDVRDRASAEEASTDAPLSRETNPDSVLRTFRGWRNVRMWRPDFAAVADSMVGFSADSTAHLYRDPILWHGDNQIDSDSITIWTAGQQLSRAEFYGSPIMAMQVDAERFNQVKGRVMTSHFRDGALYRHDAVGNAEAVYYMQEDPPADTTVVFDPSPIAFEAITASEISFLIDSQTVRYIVSRQNVHSVTYPADQIPASEPTRLAGFRWYGERRPALEDVFAREWRPSRRAQMDTLSRPAFPIAARIDRRKAYLITNRMWVDRTEPLPAHAIAFRESLHGGGTAAPRQDGYEAQRIGLRRTDAR